MDDIVAGCQANEPKEQLSLVVTHDDFKKVDETLYHQETFQGGRRGRL